MLEQYFEKFRKNVIGFEQTFVCPSGEIMPILYADWIASGRMYKPIEMVLLKEIYPMVANTHTETNVTGSTMTLAYHKAKEIIKKHVNASTDDKIICCHSGMTGALNKFQRMLGLRVHERYKSKIQLAEEDRPVVFITHMEHHSNQTSWLETLAIVEIIDHDENGLVNLDALAALLKKHAHRKHKMASITSCSNVTGIFTPYYDIAKMMHQVGGLCFVDFAASAPYIDVNMHPSHDEEAYLDALFFSPHKFLGGPGSTGVLIFNKKLYTNTVPDNPGGGTVDWTDPWGGHKYIDDIEVREDGGTPAFLQTIRASMAMLLKEEIGVANIKKREAEQIELIWPLLEQNQNLHLLAATHKNRIPVLSFYIDDLHYNIGVKILNDRFGIQVRGGCSCAGTYGHYLLNVSKDHSQRISDLINQGDFSEKLGWIRLSLHPVMSNKELLYIADAIQQLCENHAAWSEPYHEEYACNHITTLEKKESVEIQNEIAGWYDKILV